MMNKLQKKQEISRLVYVWYHDYRNGYVHNQGITLMKEYLIEANVLEEKENIKVEITIQKNPEYKCPKDFYGKNIDGVTAIIGENGGGKTTLTELLMRYPLPVIDEFTPFFWIEISDKEDIKIYQYKVNVKVAENQNIRILDWEENKTIAVYMSNMLNFAELTEKLRLDDLSTRTGRIRHIYTPVNLLIHSREQAIRQRYGYWNKDNQYLSRIKTYAEIMESSQIQSYIKKQEELIIKAYQKMPKEIREALGIFKCFEIKVRKLTDDIEVRDYSEKEKAIIRTAKEIYNRLLKGTDYNFWNNIYAACIVELYLALYEEEGTKELIENVGINNEDLSVFLLKFKLLYDKDNAWVRQMIECLDMLEQSKMGQYQDWTLGIHTYEESKEMLDWYYNELQKPFSFFKRILSFEPSPSSTGELAMMNLFSYIIDAMEHSPNQRRFLLVIDEIDVGLHPRWQQQIVKYLLDWLNSFEGYRFQIIITSHSPIVLSDILKEHVVRLKRDSEKGLWVEEMQEPTFGGNIAMQFLDSFYMDEGNIGAFSKEKIRSLIEKINNMQEYDTKERQSLEYLVDSIGEEMVRKKLRRDMQNKKPDYETLMKQWEKCSTEERRKILKYVELLRNEEE